MGLFGFVAKLSLDTTDFDKEVDKVRTKSANKLRGNILKGLFGGGYALAALSTIKNAADEALSAGDKFREMAASEGIALDKMIQLNHEAAKSGITFGELKDKIEMTGVKLKDYAETMAVSFGAQMEADAANNKQQGLFAMAKNAMGFVARQLASNMKDSSFMWWRELFGQSNDESMWRRIGGTLGGSLFKPKDREVLGPPLPPGFVNRDTAKTTFSYGDSVLDVRPNALQSIGAYSGVNMQISEQRTTNQILRTIEGNTRTFKNGRLVSETLADESTY